MADFYQAGETQGLSKEHLDEQLKEADDDEARHSQLLKGMLVKKLRNKGIEISDRPNVREFERAIAEYKNRLFEAKYHLHNKNLHMLEERVLQVQDALLGQTGIPAALGDKITLEIEAQVRQDFPEYYDLPFKALGQKEAGAGT